MNRQLRLPFALLLLTFWASPGLMALQKLERLPEVGSTLGVKEVPSKSRDLYMTHSGQVRPFIRREIKKIKYVIAYDDKTREVRYVSTHDKKFKNSSGLGIGDYLELKGSQVSIYPGWEIRGPEGEDGWTPMIGFNSELTVLRDGKELPMKVALGQHWLPADQTLKVKIIGFVKGGN